MAYRAPDATENDILKVIEITTQWSLFPDEEQAWRTNRPSFAVPAHPSLRHRPL